ncbi:hypothetical protein RHMOL_Rhmol08G0147100 [Rhododendron molle]|uniref:Uncharacterized protein n=2 Tax=Rhododendron molle TaxID=49168 RepID=A0ACC0MQI1_RHOML|nr:hypothetical protein RHMOL_Rhmol08G0147100 [Rhododendron molle]KAI8542563.1 hypothetical protein RHMOL_Rhmol08G0147100 [Rhododendron molle]
MGFGALRSILRPVSRTLLSAHCTGSSFSLARTPAAASRSSFFGGCPLHRDIRQMPVSSAFHSLTDNRFPKRRPTDKPRRKRASLRPPGPELKVAGAKIGWSFVSVSKEEGGLVFRGLRDWNKAAMFNHLWAMAKKADTLWLKWIHEYVIKASESVVVPVLCLIPCLLDLVFAGPYAWVKCVPGEPILPNQPNEGSVKRRNEKKRMRQRRAFILAEAKKRKAQLQEANRKKVIKRVERKMAAVARDRAWAEKLAELQRLEEEKKNKVMA